MRLHIKNINTFYDTIVQECLFPNKRCLEFRLKTIFKHTNFKGKRVLNIGGGAGIHSFYAAFMGAKEVTILVPESEGKQ